MKVSIIDVESLLQRKKQNANQNIVKTFINMCFVQGGGI